MSYQMSGSWRIKRNYTLSKTWENSQLLVAWLDPPALSWGPRLGESYRQPRSLMTPSLGFPCLNEDIKTRRFAVCSGRKGQLFKITAVVLRSSCPCVPPISTTHRPCAVLLPRVATGTRQGLSSMKEFYQLCLIPKNLVLSPFRNDKIPEL